MSMAPSGPSITLPPGVTVAAGRETSQAGPNGQIVQGLVFTLTLPNGAQTNVFVPYALMSNVELVAKMFADRIAAINGVVGIGGS